MEHFSLQFTAVDDWPDGVVSLVPNPLPLSQWDSCPRLDEPFWWEGEEFQRCVARKMAEKTLHIINIVTADSASSSDAG